jgi:hypothetical protein
MMYVRANPLNKSEVSLLNTGWGLFCDTALITLTIVFDKVKVENMKINKNNVSILSIFFFSFF